MAATEAAVTEGTEHDRTVPAEEKAVPEAEGLEQAIEKGADMPELPPPEAETSVSGWAQLGTSPDSKSSHEKGERPGSGASSQKTESAEAGSPDGGGKGKPSTAASIATFDFTSSEALMAIKKIELRGHSDLPGRKPGLPSPTPLPVMPQPRQPCSTPGSGSGDGNASGSSSGVLCCMCEKPRASPRARWCQMHKRAYDAISREMSGKAKKEKGCQEVANWEAAKVQDHVLFKILADFCERFPESNAKKGVKRGCVDWHEYSHLYEAAKETLFDDKAAMMDENLFVTCMERDRKWTFTYARERWQQFLSDPSVKRDSDGPRESPLRLKIPGNLFMAGVSMQTDRKRNTESKRLMEGSKRCKLGDAQVSNITKELPRGLAKDTMRAMCGDNAFSAFDESLPAGALTSGAQLLTTGDIISKASRQ